MWKVATQVCAVERTTIRPLRACVMRHCIEVSCVDRSVLCEHNLKHCWNLYFIKHLAMSWTNEMSFEFLTLYKQEPILWNPKYPNAQNRKAVKDAWSRIQSSISIEISITDLKKKKESLMTSYRSNVKKKFGTGGKYNIQWFAFDMMNSFLADIYSPTEKVSIFILLIYLRIFCGDFRCRLIIKGKNLYWLNYGERIVSLFMIEPRLGPTQGHSFELIRPNNG